jgi:hypothetical protein
MSEKKKKGLVSSMCNIYAVAHFRWDKHLHDLSLQSREKFQVVRFTTQNIKL